MACSEFARWMLLLSGEAALVVVIGATFWLQNWQYSLPTPRPVALTQPSLGSTLQLPHANLLIGSRGEVTDRPILLHFFNPACPCSRFNAPHLQELLNQFEDQVTIIAVLEADDPLQARDDFAAWQLDCPAMIDSGGEIAHSIGVYSTPQAVVLDRQGRLYYRGNYNLSRYCVSPETEFVRLALEACTRGQPLPTFPAAAMIAQGCPLPIDRLMRNEDRPR